MRKIALTEIKSIPEYEAARSGWKKEVLELKKRRRVQVGERISLHFENRETLLSQIQEMVRIERITNPEKVQEEVDVYNELIPAPHELSATLFIEVSEQSKIQEELLSLLGLDEPGVVFFEIGKERVFGVFEQGRSTEEKISSVHYVKFPFSKSAEDAFRRGEPTFVVADHPNYKVRIAATAETRQELIKDLEA